MIQANFVVPLFQGGDLCDIDGNTDSFQDRLNGSKQNFEVVFTAILAMEYHRLQLTVTHGGQLYILERYN